MKKIFNKYKLSFLIAIIILVIGIILLILFNNKNNSVLKTLVNSSFISNYDNSWKIKNNIDSNVVLEHIKTKSILTIEIIELEDEYKYQTISEIKDDFMYEIEVQNKNYNLIAQESTKLTKNNYDGYKILYELDERQSLVLIGKTNNKLIIFNYKADFIYFDLLLDSVNNIIYNFDLTKENYKLTYNMDYELTEMNFKDNELLDSNLKDTNDYEIGVNNYLVNYSIPSNFILNSFNSTFNYFSYDEENYRISINATIYRRNIYEYIDRNTDSWMYEEYEQIQKNEEYSNQKEELINLENNNYAYKISYISKGTKYDDNFEKIEYDKLNEVIYLLYNLDKNHVFEIKINSTDIEISKNFIDMIKINSKKSISSNFDIVTLDNNLIGELKRYTDYNKDKVELVKLKLPTKYTEIDKETNLFEKRNYVIGYNEDTGIYDYEITYSLIDGYDMNRSIENINSGYKSYSSYGEYKTLENIDTKTLNEKDFNIYKGYYYYRTGGLLKTEEDFIYKINTIVLFYTISEDSYLQIEIECNDKEISEEILKDLTNFEINYLKICYNKNV